MKKKSLIVLCFIVVIAFSVVYVNRPVNADSNTTIDYPSDVVIKSGVAKGYKSDIKVDVALHNDEIIDVVVIEQNESNRYFRKSLVITEAIISAQSTEVDAISGATFTSKGILDAVTIALNSN